MRDGGQTEQELGGVHRKASMAFIALFASVHSIMCIRQMVLLRSVLISPLGCGDTRFTTKNYHKSVHDARVWRGESAPNSTPFRAVTMAYSTLFCWVGWGERLLVVCVIIPPPSPHVLTVTPASITVRVMSASLCMGCGVLRSILVGGAAECIMKHFFIPTQLSAPPDGSRVEGSWCRCHLAHSPEMLSVYPHVSCASPKASSCIDRRIVTYLDFSFFDRLYLLFCFCELC